MKSLSAPVVTALSAREVALVTLVKLAFSSGTILLNSSNWNLTYAAETYLGAAGLGTISVISDQPGELPGLQLELMRVDSAYISMALDDADVVQGAAVTISTAIMDVANMTILHVEPDFTGYGDTMAIAEDGQSCSISMTVESKGVDLLRGNPLTYSDADQQSLASGDRYFEYVADQADKPVVWPSRAYFFR